MLPANTGGGVNEWLINQAEISKKEDDIILLQYLTFFFFAFMCYFAFISKQANKKTAKSGFLLRDSFLKVCGIESIESSKKKKKQTGWHKGRGSRFI